MPSSFQPMISVIIKTYDDSAVVHPRARFTLKDMLLETLLALETQSLLPYEVLVVDSSVGNGIAEVINAFKQTHEENFLLRRVILSHKDFSHPRALNLGVQHATGDVVVILSGDATPANARWLEMLVAPLVDPKVAGAFSRQVARPGMRSCWAERFRLWWRYRSRKTMLRYQDHLFSNASAAFMRHLALDIPFDETLVELEDYTWAREVQQRGYALAYVGESEVFHSHDSSNLKTVWRMFYYLYLRMKTDMQSSPSADE